MEPMDTLEKMKAEREERMEEMREEGSFGGPASRDPKTVQQEIRKIRHKKELPLYILCSVLGVIAMVLTEGVHLRETMMMLSVGRHAYKYMDADAYLKDIASPKGALVRLARWITNMLVTHPILPFRLSALLDEDQKSGRLL